MAEQVALKAETGRELGSSSSRRLRRTGRIPGVVYGLGADPVAISVDYSETRQALSGDAGLNALLNLDINGSHELCVVKDLQRHVTRDEVTHIDFFRVDANADVQVDVPVIMTGDAKAVTAMSGMVDQNLFMLTVETKPTNIPNEIEVDISELEIGGTIRVVDLVLPEGVIAMNDEEETIATAMVTRSTLEAMRAEEEGEAAEGEEAAAAAPAEDSADE